MADATARRERPLSPHLSIYRPPISMVMSIVHRITGGALYFGTLLLAWWLVAVAMGREALDTFNTVAGSLPGRLVLLGYTWALIHHMLGGLRHLLWDTGRGFDKASIKRLSWLTVLGSLVLTALVWGAGGYFARFM